MRRTEQAQGLTMMKFEEDCARTRSRLLSQAEAAEVQGMSERTFRRCVAIALRPTAQRGSTTAAWADSRPGAPCEA